MVISKKQITVAILFCLIVLLYLSAVFLTFAPRSSGSDYGDIITYVFTLSAGLLIFGLGYASIVIFGGKASLGLVELIARLNGSKHALEIKDKKERQTQVVRNFVPLLYTPALILLIALAIAVNIHYLDSTFSVTFQSLPSPVIREVLVGLDIFLKPTTIGSLRYSIEIIPIMALFVALAGIIPAIVFPYLRSFKINSVNGAPFHKGILLGAVGTVLGLTIILSLFNIVYGVLVGTQPHYYSYMLPTLLGFSLHYFLGIYVGSEKAEKMIEKSLRVERRKRVFQGKIIIQQNDGKD